MGMQIPRGRPLHDRMCSLDVKASDKVLFGKHAGREVKVDGEEILVMREEDVIAVL